MEFHENWLDSWKYLEERLEFFLKFSVHTSFQQWALKWKKRDLNSQKCHKIRDLKTCTRQTSTKINSMIRCYSGEHLKFFQNFPPIPRSSSEQFAHTSEKKTSTHCYSLKKPQGAVFSNFAKYRHVKKALRVLKLEKILEGLIKMNNFQCAPKRCNHRFGDLRRVKILRVWFWCPWTCEIENFESVPVNLYQQIKIFDCRKSPSFQCSQTNFNFFL